MYQYFVIECLLSTCMRNYWNSNSCLTLLDTGFDFNMETFVLLLFMQY